MDTYNSLKQKFLAVYDYGTGGAWYVICAKNKEEILAKFPKLQVYDYDKPPSSLSPETYKFVISGRCYDIDDPPEGSLAMMMKIDQ